MSQAVLRKRSNILRNSVLYKYQKTLLNGIDKNYIIAADTGTGKTIMAIYHYLKNTKGEPLLIVAPPQKIKEGGWDHDIKFISDEHGIEIEYETLSYGVLSKRYTDYKDWFVIFDECHYIKNPTSQRGKAGINLTKKSTHYLLLSATPSSNGWGDTIAYMIMFGFYKNKTQFLKEHAIYEDKFVGRPKPVKVVSDYKDQERLKEIYQSFSIKLAKEDCLDLPGIVFKDIKFKATKEYKTIEKDRVLGDELYDTISKLQHGLRVHANQTDKLEYTKMLAEGTEENIIVFYYYQQEKEALQEMLKKLGKTIFEVSGQASNLPSKDTWKDLSDSVTLVQYMAGAAGIELQYASMVVMYTPTYSFQDYDQSLGRAYRNGQTKKVTVYRYMTDKTIEMAIYGALKEKRNFTEDLFRKEISA